MTEDYVVFSEGGGSNASYKLYVTVTQGEDDNSHPRWTGSLHSATKDEETGSPSWVAMRSGDTTGGALVAHQTQVYAGVAE